MERKSIQMILSVVLVMIIITSLFTGIYLLFTSPESASSTPIDAEDARVVNSNYMGDAYAVTLAGEENQSIKYRLNEGYTKAEYDMEIYYTNNTGLHSDIQTFGGAGSSSVASNFETMEGTITKSTMKTRKLDSSYAVAIINFDSKASLKQGYIRGFPNQSLTGAILFALSSALAIFIGEIISLGKD